MYLAQYRTAEGIRYSLRRSVQDDLGSRYKYEEVFDLGLDPSVYINEEFAGCVYFSSELEKVVSTHSKMPGEKTA